MWSPCIPWAHWSHMAGYILNVISICPLGTLYSHNWVHFECIWFLPTGHIVITYWLDSQCIQHVPTDYWGPCPQCLNIGVPIKALSKSAGSSEPLAITSPDVLLSSTSSIKREITSLSFMRVRFEAMFPRRMSLRLATLIEDGTDQLLTELATQHVTNSRLPDRTPRSE